MSLRYLLGPVSADWARRWQPERDAGHCRAFNDRGDLDLTVGFGDSWEDICHKLPADWQADFIALSLNYTTVPRSFWSAPVPLVGLATDWNLQWHHYRRALRRCDLVLIDLPGVQALAREGFRHARPANLFGCDPEWLDGPWPDSPRDIDILFVGNLQPAVQRERLAWLGRLARLGEHWKVVIASGVFGAEYRSLLARSRIVFNRSIRGECNMRAMEAAAAGALLFQEAENQETHDYFRHQQECIYYRDEDLESQLEHYLSHEEERAALAAAARERVKDYSAPALWNRSLRVVGAEWTELLERAASREPCSHEEEMLGRTWQAMSAAEGTDPELHADLARALEQQPRSALLHNTLGVIASLARTQPAGLAEHFRRAVAADPLHLVAALNLAAVLAELRADELAVKEAVRVLAALDRVEAFSQAVLDAPSYPPGFDVLRVEWERAAWENAGRPAAEAQAKHDLLRWRAHALAARLTGDTGHYREAALARPDLPATRAALGCALARSGRPAEGVWHLRRAVATNPFDRPAARALYQALGETDNYSGQQALAADRRFLARAAPGAIPPEQWFSEPPSDGPTDAASRIAITWEGVQDEVQSLALVNRQLCQRLIGRGHEVCLLPPRIPRDPGVPRLPLPPPLADRYDVDLSGPSDVHIRHAWPPDFTPPPTGRLVLMQPWEFGSLPRAWVGPIREHVAEVWAYTNAVRDCYVESGVPAERVHVVPLGVDTPRFRPGLAPLPLKTRRRFQFLFVGGTIRRKGIDVLLDAYARAFTDADDVCLVIKDMGTGSFYRGQTAEADIARLQSQPGAPEIEYIDHPLSEEELAGLYAACDCLVSPYRGEGFGLPIAEAMACGLPVVVTGLGAALDYCDASRAYIIPAEKRYFAEPRVGEWQTVDRPWLAEPNVEALVAILRHVVSHPEEARAKGAAGSPFVRDHLTWEQSADAVEQRLQALRRGIDSQSLPLRNRRIAHPSSNGRQVRVSLCMIVKNEEENLPDCLASIRDLVDEIIIVDTGSTDRTREIAAQFGARVFDFPWVDSFAAARNESQRHATGDWIFWMDADDRLDDENRAGLRTLFAGLKDENAAYVMKCLCVAGSQNQDSTVVDHVRLYRNRPDLRWDYRVHEQILPSIRETNGDVRWTEVVVRHVGYADPALRQRKLERDMRLLKIDDAERPNRPFVLFNLGSVSQELGNVSEALEYFRRSLERSHPADSITRKLFALIAGCCWRLGRREDALAVCAEGRGFYPDDAELLYREGGYRQDLGDFGAAENCWRRLIEGREGPHFGSTGAGLRGYLARHHLAVCCLRRNALDEAERHWRAALAERPGMTEAQQGLEELRRRRSQF